MKVKIGEALETWLEEKDNLENGMIDNQQRSGGY